MWDYVTTADSFVFIINRAVPYYVAACAVAIGFKMNLFNIGVDGQYRLAALFAAAAGAALDLPALFQISAILLVAMVVGGAYAAIPGVLKVTRGVNEVVSTIMLNFVAVGITAYLLANNFRNERGHAPGRDRSTATLGPAPPDERLPREVRHRPARAADRASCPSPSSVGIAFYVIIYRTRFGFDLRTSGKNPNAARSSGVNPKAMILKTMILSGHDRRAGRHVAALTEFHKYGDTFPLGIGFTGIAVALLGPQQSGRHRRRGHRLGRHRAGLAEPELRRRAPGDRPDPAGHAAAVGRHRLRGRPALPPAADREGGR